MIQKYDTKSVCVVDNGLFVELAVKLAKWFGRVYYIKPWQGSAFPKSNDQLIGQGLPGVEVVRYLWDTNGDGGRFVDDVDLFVFPDVYLGDYQEELIRQGKRVFGSRRGDELELFRDESKKYFKKIGLPIGDYEVIKGIDSLREFLKENNDQYVKISLTRGDFETFHSLNYKLAEPKIDELEARLGAKKYNIEFIVEAAIHGVETGYDGFCVDGQYPETALAGFEIKDKCYLMKVLPYKDLPSQITDFNKAVAPALKQYNYRNFVSTEIRIEKKSKTPYMIDFCARCGSPPSEIMLELIENLPDIFWFGAEGQCIDIEAKHKWAAEILLESAWADTNWQAVQFPPKFREWVKLRNATKINNEYYVVPQSSSCPEIGAVIGMGQTMEEAIEMAKEVASNVRGYFVESFPSALDNAVEEMEKLEAFGISFKQSGDKNRQSEG